MYSTLSTLTCPIHPLFQEVGCMMCPQTHSTSIYPEFTALLVGPYQEIPQVKFPAAAASIISPEPRKTIPQISINTDFWCGPLESVHDHYPERLALSPEDRVQMFAGKYSCEDLALSPTLTLLPVQGEEDPEDEDANRVRRRRRAVKKQDPLRVMRGSKVSKSTRVAGLNLSALPLPPKRFYKFRDGRPTKRSREALDKIRLQRWNARAPTEQIQSAINASACTSTPLSVKKSEGSSKEERATKLKERVRRRSQRARRELSPHTESSSESEGSVSRSNSTTPAKKGERQRVIDETYNAFSAGGRAVTRSKAKQKAAQGPARKRTRSSGCPR